MEGHITIYGEIIPWQESEAGKYGTVNLRSVMDEINSQPKATEFTVHIHSIGGDVDEAFAMYDALKATGKPLTTMIEGMCASAATVPALAAETRKMTENSQIMIHLPIAGKQGTAEEMREAAARLQAYETKVLNLYMLATGSESEAIKAMMKAETWLSAEQSVDLGFITELVPTMKAVATINFKTNTMAQMTSKEFDDKLEKNSKSLMSQFKAFLKGGVKMITVATVDGKVLDFGDAITEEGQIAVGSKATVEGSPAEGEYVLTDGRTLVFAAGAITEIKEAEGGETVEGLQAKLDEANAKIATLETAQATAKTDKVAAEASVTKMQADFETFKTTMKSGMGIKDPENRESDESGGGKKDRKLWKDK